MHLNVQPKSWHAVPTLYLHVIPNVMTYAVNVATWELFPIMLLKKLVVRSTDLVSLVTVEWYLRNAAMGEVICILLSYILNK